MKSFLKYTSSKELSELIEPVEDFYEYVNDNAFNGTSKSLVKKTLIIEHMSKVSGINLNKFFKDKLIFKMFNENDWNFEKLKNGSNAQNFFIKLAKTHGIDMSTNKGK